MNKTITVLAVLALGLGAALPAFAAGTTTPAGTSSATLSCVGSAVAAREGALGTGVGTFNQAVASAYSSRATALAAAYATGNASQVRTGVKAAWSAFSKSVSAARSSWKTARLGAWSTYRTAVKACHASASVTDSQNSASEVAS